MPEAFDGYQFLSHLRARWRLPLIVCAAAIGVALAASLLLPKEYTAKVTLVIEQPAGSDPRASTSVSPIYLESLRTYEHFAAGDRLFAQAVDRFQLRKLWPRRSIESLKRAVLRVTLLRNTKILEISATLPDAQKAHALALYLAEESIQLSRRTSRAGDELLIEDARKQAGEAARRLAAAESARGEFRRRRPTLEELKTGVEDLREMRGEVERLLLSADLSKADGKAASGRGEQLRRRLSDLDSQTGDRQKLLAERTAASDALESEYESTWTEHDQMERRLREAQGMAGYRGERLAIVDPGVVPERPSFPDLPLNLLVAAALGLIASWLYLTAEFSLQTHKAESMRKALRVASKS